MGLASIAMGSAFVAAAEPGFVLEIKYGRVPDSVRLIRVKQGDLVKLRWTSDQPLVVHLHGYDIEQPVDPGVVTDMTFAAYATGRFPVYVHAQAVRGGGPAHEGGALINVEVYPR